MSNTTRFADNEPSESGLVSIKTASQMLGLGPWDVAKLCETGVLPSAHIGERLVIPRSAVFHFADMGVAS